MRNLTFAFCLLFLLASWKTEEIALPQNDGPPVTNATDYLFEITRIEINEKTWIIDYSFMARGILDAELTFNWNVVVLYNSGVYSRFPQYKTFTPGQTVAWDTAILIESLGDNVRPHNVREIYIEKSSIVYNGAYNIVAPDWN